MRSVRTQLLDTILCTLHYNNSHNLNRIYLCRHLDFFRGGRVVVLRDRKVVKVGRFDNEIAGGAVRLELFDFEVVSLIVDDFSDQKVRPVVGAG